MTNDQRKNIKTLAIWVLKNKPKLNMHDYASSRVSPCDVDCGTASCFAGHGPVAGIKPKKGEDWCDYVARAFGNYSWGFLFDPYWPNSHRQSVARAYRLLNKGVPKKYSYTMSKYRIPSLKELKAV